VEFWNLNDTAVLDRSKTCLYIPSSTNFPAADAFVPEVGIFQITVARQHDIAFSVVKSLRHFKCDTIFFVTPYREGIRVKFGNIPTTAIEEDINIFHSLKMYFLPLDGGIAKEIYDKTHVPKSEDEEN